MFPGFIKLKRSRPLNPQLYTGKIFSMLFKDSLLINDKRYEKSQILMGEEASIRVARKEKKNLLRFTVASTSYSCHESCWFHVNSVD